MKKIMIIDGGPRKNMNTAAMIEASTSNQSSVGTKSIGRRNCKTPSMLESGWQRS